MCAARLCTRARVSRDGKTPRAAPMMPCPATPVHPSRHLTLHALHDSSEVCTSYATVVKGGGGRPTRIALSWHNHHARKGSSIPQLACRLARALCYNMTLVAFLYRHGHISCGGCELVGPAPPLGAALLAGSSLSFLRSLCRGSSPPVRAQERLLVSLLTPPAPLSLLLPPESPCA